MRLPSGAAASACTAPVAGTQGDTRFPPPSLMKAPTPGRGWPATVVKFPAKYTVEPSGETVIDRTGLGALLLPVSGSHEGSTVPEVALTRAMWLRAWALAVPRAPNLVNSPPT